MNKITNAGLIAAAFILAAGMMFSTSKDITAWMFVVAGGYTYIKSYIASLQQSNDEEDDEDED